MFQDAELEKYLNKLKNSPMNNNLTNYKKATMRLDNLTEEYDKLCKLLKKKPNVKNKQSIQILIEKLEELNASLNNEDCDMCEIIQNYVQQKKVLDDLTGEISNTKNELFQVNNQLNKIKLVKIKLPE